MPAEKTSDEKADASEGKKSCLNEKLEGGCHMIRILLSEDGDGSEAARVMAG